MSQDIMSNDSQRSEAQAAQLVELLNEVYRGYMESSRSQEKSFRGIARLFRRWISFNPAVDEPLHQKFVDDVEGIIAELAHALDALGQKDPALCNLYAAKAADLILAPKPGREKTTAEWYMTIAEYKCAAILPYLATDVLRRIRDAQLKATPKRMMYPRQRELFDYIEKLLANRK